MREIKRVLPLKLELRKALRSNNNNNSSSNCHSNPKKKAKNKRQLVAMTLESKRKQL
jgi:hypothetical protein